MSWAAEVPDREVCIDLKKKLISDGYLKLPICLPEQRCSALRDIIDEMESAESEINYGESEVRVWDIEKKHGAVAGFQSDLDCYIRATLECTPRLDTTLGIRNTAISGDDFRAGRWHIDSFMPQFKAFCFLSAVSDRNGPFSFMLGTHTRGFKFSQFIRGTYFGVSDVFTGSRKYTRISDNFVESLIANGRSYKELTCSAGDIFIVNTSMIHRAKPCEHGSRYALTSYYGSFF